LIECKNEIDYGRCVLRDTEVHTHDGVVVWTAGSRRAPVDVWFHPALGDSHLTFRHAFTSELLARARVLAYDPPGHGASPPRRKGLTLTQAARLWCELIQRFSGSRPVVLIGHSMAGIVASWAASMLRRAPALVIGVEANLTPADAYFTGLAAEFKEPLAFYAMLRSRVLQMARNDEGARRFACSLEFADPMTLWALGRSVAVQRDPGRAFRRLSCPKLHYWDRSGTSKDARNYLAKHRLPNRSLSGMGHWPMTTAPVEFHATVAKDLAAVARRGRD
jgi:pimeloyl-ACP methyl ester carboxylesterase